MKPRDSMPTTLSIRSCCQRATNASITSRNSFPSERTGVMSLKTIPFFGKSGTSRIRARMASMAGILAEAGGGQKKTALADGGGIGRGGPKDLGGLSAHFVAWVGEALNGHRVESRQVEHRVARPRTFSHLEVQVGAGGAAGLTHPGDGGAARHLLAFLHQQDAGVRVKRHQASLVLQDDDRAVARLLASVDHLAGGGRADDRPFRRGDVDPVVALSL